MQAPQPLRTFIVRVTIGDDGRLLGIVERPRTGQKIRFAGAMELTDVMTRLAALPEGRAPEAAGEPAP